MVKSHKLRIILFSISKISNYISLVIDHN